MNSKEFYEGMFRIRCAFGHKFDKEEQIRTWYAVFKHISAEAWLAAVARTLVEHKGGFPTIAQVVEYVDEFENGIDPEHSDAFEMVKRAIDRFGWYEPEKAMQSLPPVVQETIRALGGFRAICDSPVDHRGILRAQFRDIYNQKREQRRTLSRLPESCRPKLNHLPDVRAAAGRIGKMPEDSGV